MAQNECVRVAIIGTAGRGADGLRMNKELFFNMCAVTKNCLSEWKLNPQRVHLVSGGAAWADHVAVRLFLDGLDFDDDKKEERFAGLTLWLPCPFSNAKALDNNLKTWQLNPGRTMNAYHH